MLQLASFGAYLDGTHTQVKWRQLANLLKTGRRFLQALREILPGLRSLSGDVPGGSVDESDDPH
jgi:hypothetical protein